MVQQAFRGFVALPPPSAKRRWRDVIGVVANATPDEVKAAYRDKARDLHPDNGGSDVGMAELNAAYDEFKKQRGIA